MCNSWRSYAGIVFHEYNRPGSSWNRIPKPQSELGFKVQVQGLSNSVWASAKVLIKDEELCEAVARASIPKAAELTSQEMGKTWPFKGSLNGLQSYDEGLGTVGVG
eukprot:s307_g20.t1